MGLDKDEPNDTFQERFRDAVKNRPELQALPIPPHVLERMAFCIAKESFQSTIADIRASDTESA